ncbi:MAG TPA: Ppx/GppA phosphatase family protein [Methylomirabilota bacterium]|nr:Ppx/GppA phosphatase family protein [Methylomirabilota bacterium]
MRLAAIDLGSNTIHLLIAEVAAGARDWHVVERDQRVTRLGEGLARAGALGEAPMARTVGAVTDYAGRAAAAGAERILIVATSAVREASNGRAFVASLEAATGRRVSVVSGEEEARLTLRGVLHALGTLPGTVVTFDIGGGSTEYLLARDGAVASSHSLRLGVVPLAERFPFPGPVERARYEALRGEIAAQLAREVPAEIRGAAIDRLVGTAGTVTTLAALDLGLARYDAARVQGHVLTRTAVERLLALLAALPVSGRGALPCLEPARADLIVPGTAIVLETLACLRLPALTVSDFGLREGILVDALEPPPARDRN